MTPERQRRLALAQQSAVELLDRLGDFLAAAAREAVGDEDYDAMAEWGSVLENAAITIGFELGSEPEVWARFVATRIHQWRESQEDATRPEQPSVLPQYFEGLPPVLPDVGRVP